MNADIIFDLYKYDPEEHPPTIVYKAIKEIKSLRQQLASRDAEIAKLKDALGYDWDKYKASQKALLECMKMVAEQDAEIAELVAFMLDVAKNTSDHTTTDVIDEYLAKVRKP